MEVSFPSDPEFVALLRRLSARLLNRSGLRDPGVVDTVELLVSEIAANAVKYGTGGGVTLTLECDPLSEVRIEVDDHSTTGTPEVRHPGPEEESGRGMQLVALLSQAWGRKGTRTWCTVPTRP